MAGASPKSVQLFKFNTKRKDYRMKYIFSGVSFSVQSRMARASMSAV